MGARCPLSKGLSPRVRGNLDAVGANRREVGSIPARAGEPRAYCRLKCHYGVYPRACGGTPTGGYDGPCMRGLSPRVRGNRPAPPPSSSGPGSIPARAGEPTARTAAPPIIRVYPRACGGTFEEGPHGRAISGLSPRVRGNRRHLAAGVDLARSIPARAGEPCICADIAANPGVYPRACGGTCCAGHEWTWNGGLSPRVRGNRG